MLTLLTDICGTACEGPRMSLVHPSVRVTLLWQFCISIKKQMHSWKW